MCYANSVLGARSNREGGPSALAAALTGVTPAYGYHLDLERTPDITVQVTTELQGNDDFGALGKAIGDRLVSAGMKKVPYIRGVPEASLEALKSLSASIATYGGVALFHMEGITPEVCRVSPHKDGLTIGQAELDQAKHEMSDPAAGDADFVTLGCQIGRAHV